ncbi:aspartyl protease family protein [Methylobacterium brachiatum]|uniref:aspartyl protease family protein n=1 Tax=Methylobacterium brachiatum TaxID=269660 RepID=UPI002449CCA2|nr:hypothetical protein [Methylobacterium brachiatum]MDH2311411.1 hypothetical protein [Methylobacterium brachiatum]
MARVIDGWFGPAQKGEHPPELWCPFIKLSIPDPSWSAGTLPVPYIATDLAALVDTGAATCAISHRLANRLKLKTMREGVSLVVGNSVPTISYRAWLVVSEFNLGYDLELVGQDLPEDKVNFELIIGWSFLRYYALSLSRPNDLVQLQKID